MQDSSLISIIFVMFAGVFISTMFPQSPISHISAQFIELKYRIPDSMQSRISVFKLLDRTLVEIFAFSARPLRGVCELVAEVFVQYLKSICELAVDGWEKFFGTNSSSFHHKWATGRNFNRTNMRMPTK